MTVDGYTHVKGGDTIAATNVAQIKSDLKGQLRNIHKNGKYFDDLIEDYIYLWKLKKKLQKDIKERGIRYISANGNGIKVEKPNESVQNLLKVTAQMMKLLTDMGLQEPTIGGDDEGYLSLF